jgi:hypothetical protein
MVIKDLEDILARLMSLDQMDDWHFALFALGIVEIGSTKKRRHKREALQAPDAMHEEGHGGEPRTGNYTHTTKDKHYGRTTSQLKDVNLFRPGSAVFVALEGGNGKLIAEPVIMVAGLQAQSYCRYVSPLLLITKHSSRPLCFP